jgi:hypothetical protein
MLLESGRCPLYRDESQGRHIAVALESIAASLAKLANPAGALMDAPLPVPESATLTELWSGKYFHRRGGD